jgi:hypothetical protein
MDGGTPVRCVKVLFITIYPEAVHAERELIELELTYTSGILSYFVCSLCMVKNGR